MGTKLDGRFGLMLDVGPDKVVFDGRPVLGAAKAIDITHVTRMRANDGDHMMFLAQSRNQCCVYNFGLEERIS